MIEKDFLYKELTYEVLGCAYDAFKTVGAGYDEIIYHKVFHRNLLKKRLKAWYKKPEYLEYDGERIAEFEIDETVEDKIIVELKNIQTDFLPENYGQIMTYLKLTKLRLGLLINFGLDKAIPKRIIFDEVRIQNLEQWDKDYFQSPSIRELVDAIIASVHQIDSSLGTGYLAKTYQAAMGVELKRNKMDYYDKVSVEIKYEDLDFKSFEIDYWLVNKSLLLGVLAGKDNPRTYDLSRMRSYLRRLNIRHGLITYWSTKNLQLYGIYEP